VYATREVYSNDKTLLKFISLKIKEFKKEAREKEQVVGFISENFHIRMTKEHPTVSEIVIMKHNIDTAKNEYLQIKRK
jgi:hypothetical protein